MVGSLFEYGRIFVRTQKDIYSNTVGSLLEHRGSLFDTEEALLEHWRIFVRTQKDIYSNTVGFLFENGRIFIQNVRFDVQIWKMIIIGKLFCSTLESAKKCEFEKKIFLAKSSYIVKIYAKTSPKIDIIYIFERPSIMTF